MSRILPFDDGYRLLRAVAKGLAPGSRDRDCGALRACEMDITLARGASQRCYRIVVDAEWAIARACIYFDHALHRSEFAADPRRLSTVRAQFQREVDALRADGWQ